MRNFQGTFERCKRTFISVFSIYMTVLLNPPLLFISKTHDMSCHEILERRHSYLPCHVEKSDTGYTRREQQ